MRIDFVLNSYSWQCEFNAYCVRSNEQLGRSDSMGIKAVVILCHVIITSWWTAWKWRPFSTFVSAWVHPPDMHFARTLLSFVTLQWCLKVLGVVQEGTVSHDFHPLPTHFNRDALRIHFQSTSWCGLNECAFDAHRAKAPPMDLHVNANDANSMSIGSTMWMGLKKSYCSSWLVRHAVAWHCMLARCTEGVTGKASNKAIDFEL